MEAEVTTIDSWIQYAKDNRDKLASIISEYHPVVRKQRVWGSDRITAQSAERACEFVRQEIKKNFEGNPIQQFDEAIEKKDVNKIMNLLNQVWFGVPETTECWHIEGFKELIHLVDDPPEATAPKAREI